MLKKILINFLILLIIVLILFQFLKREKLVFEGRDLSPYVEEEYTDKVAETLKNAGENREELIKFLTRVDPVYKKGASFLLAFMPYVDAVEIKAEVLLDNINYAYKAKEEFLWAKDIPENIFLNYLLPYRNSQEPIQNWRPFFYQKLHPVVKDLTSGQEVAYAVNRWIADRVKYKYTQREDQGPFETLKGGYGRCEELVIIYNDALRSVGIPARKVWTPYWPTQNDNHAWTEVWVDGKWWYTGAAEPTKDLNKAWFDKTVKKTALVFSKPYGEPDTTERTYQSKTGGLYINTTDVYTQTGIFEIQVVDKNKKLEGAAVCISVFNYGALRRIAKLKTDKNGKASISIGKGTYFISTGDSECYNWKVASIKEDEKNAILLDLAEQPEEKEEFRLVY
jgi:hypothetical protein